MMAVRSREAWLRWMLRIIRHPTSVLARQHHHPMVFVQDLIAYDRIRCKVSLLDWFSGECFVQNLEDRQHTLPSNRAFGLLVVFSGYLFSAWSYKESRSELAINVACGASIILIITLLAPRVLYPFNWAWHKLGLIMGNIVSPIVLGFIFFFLITPV